MTPMAASPLRGETRPQKRICPPQTRSPHSDLSHPPLENWCAERVHHHFSSVWQLGDVSGFPPLQSVLLPPAGHVLGDTVGSLLQRTDPVPAIFQSSTSLSIIANKDAEGFPSCWRASLLPGLLDTPTQVCLPLHDTLLPLSHFIHKPCFGGFTWIPFRCRPVWLLPGYPILQHVWPASS